VVVLFGARFELGSDLPELVLVLAQLPFEVDELRLDIALLHTLQVHLLCQQVNLVLLLGRQLVMRSLH